ncbi:hypothetical protein F4780DRAFT_782799 [Xylariomycetidae sp. FL0641]|nr:hypothetical protein F4780DRAFT_782799 [Xylariomycetidae sp. FL0641]
MVGTCRIRTKVPEGFKLEEVVTIPENFVTAFNTLAHDHILIWGAASSVGKLLIQVLRFYGYDNIIVTASPKHYACLEELGAAQCYDYRSRTVIEDLMRAGADPPGPPYLLMVDCIGSQYSTLGPLSCIAMYRSVVAVMLPVIVRHPTNDEAPVFYYSMDADAYANWDREVTVRGNDLFRKKLQLEIMPQLLASGVIRPRRYTVVEGDTLLERATKALDVMRKGASGEKMIWRVSEPSDI